MIDKTNPKREDNSPNWQPAFYLNDNKIEIYKTFEYADKVSKATFFNYLKRSGRFKKPHRLTDLCNYCENLRDLKRNLPHELEKFNCYTGENNALAVNECKKRVIKRQRELSLANADSTEITEVNRLQIAVNLTVFY